jgi:hypothetical protein
LLGAPQSYFIAIGDSLAKFLDLLDLLGQLLSKALFQRLQGAY